MNTGDIAKLVQYQWVFYFDKIFDMTLSEIKTINDHLIGICVRESKRSNGPEPGIDSSTWNKRGDKR